MSLIPGRKQSKPKHDRALVIVRLLTRALVAQRVARKAHKGYKWTRRMPYILAGGAIAALVARTALQRGQSSTPEQAGFTPPTPATPSPAAPAAASTPTPTGSPTAVTPAPTAKAPEDDGAPTGETEEPKA
jgi:hypothetical protein